MTTASVGAQFEALAAWHLERAGLRVVERNWHSRYGELDLVMRDGEVLVFVEVRYRRDSRFGGGAASVGPGKRAKLVRAAQGFLEAHPALARLPCRFDVVAFDGKAVAPTLDWQRAAFDAV